jgi:hypothetical protein
MEENLLLYFRLPPHCTSRELPFAAATDYCVVLFFYEEGVA